MNRTLATLLLATGIASAQNPAPTAPTPGRTSSSAVDNEFIRVTKVTQQPHLKTRSHQHNMNRVMVYLTAGTQVNDYQDGNKEVLNFKVGEPLWSASGGIHVAEVTSGDPITIVEMELRKAGGRTPATTLDPLKVDPRHYTPEFENLQVRVFRVKIGAHEKTPLHEHILGRVSVFLTDHTVRITSPDGNSEVVARKAGEIAWGEGGKHQEENLGDQPLEAVVVEVK